MTIELKEAMRVEALVNLFEKQRDFLHEHPLARIYMGSGAPDEHVVVIEDRSCRFEGRARSYEDALSLALEEAWCRDTQLRLRPS